MFDVFRFAHRVRIAVYFCGLDVYLNVGTRFITLRTLSFLTLRLLSPAHPHERSGEHEYFDTVFEINKIGQTNSKRCCSTVVKQVIQMVQEPQPTGTTQSTWCNRMHIKINRNNMEFWREPRMPNLFQMSQSIAYGEASKNYMKIRDLFAERWSPSQ
jgi:hypothetical protein